MSGRDNTVILNFNPSLLRDGLSVVLRIDDTLWVANDETTHLERLNIQHSTPGEEVICDEHRSFPLMEYLTLPDEDPEEEIDIEGLAYDHDQGYLWVVGSHSLKRKKVDPDKPAQKNIKRLSTLEADGNRFLLARVPVVHQHGRHELSKVVEADGRTAAQLKGNALGNELTREIAQDDHLRDFLRIPGKDNGFDIEGMAAMGSRLFLGLRGPVLRGWAVILEIEPELDDGSTDTLVLKKIGPQGRGYRKHFLALHGLGVRDLCASGNDLLILAGPTMDLDGPVTVFRWHAGLSAAEESVVFAEQLKVVLQVPFGQGDDHAEGICVFEVDEHATESVLIVYDAAAARRKRGDNSVEGDLFALK